MKRKKIVKRECDDSVYGGETEVILYTQHTAFCISYFAVKLSRQEFEAGRRWYCIAILLLGDESFEKGNQVKGEEVREEEDKRNKILYERNSLYEVKQYKSKERWKEIDGKK